MNRVLYLVIKILETQPPTGQRELAETLGVSLGKANYCLRALLNKGLVKIEKFDPHEAGSGRLQPRKAARNSTFRAAQTTRRSSNKKGYLYKLTPEGMREKAAVTLRFLKRKMTEYETLRHEIQTLKSEVSSLDTIEEASD